jgi:two-component system, OmpR family, response regulator
MELLSQRLIGTAYMPVATSQNAPLYGKPKVLVVDDDPEISSILSRYLQNQGLDVQIAENGAQVRAALNPPSFDVVLLDLGLPDMDGLGLMRELRSCWSGPVIIVSGRGESVERVVGLELGADDYVSKPFDLRELLARIRSVLRRAQPLPPAEIPHIFTFDGMSLNIAARQLTGRIGEDIGLTTGELDLLLIFVQRPHQVLSRDQLMNAIHGRDTGPYDRAIDVQVGRLRRKLEIDPENPRLIKSVRGAGYLFASSVRQG